MVTPGAVVVFRATSDEVTTQGLAAKVLTGKLTACTTPLPGATSFYYWEGKLEQEYEIQVLLKADLARQQVLLDCPKSHHPYQTPELLVLPIIHGNNGYFSWPTALLRWSCYHAARQPPPGYSTRRGARTSYPLTRPSPLTFSGSSTMST